MLHEYQVQANTLYSNTSCIDVSYALNYMGNRWIADMETVLFLIACVLISQVQRPIGLQLEQKNCEIML